MENDISKNKMPQPENTATECTKRWILKGLSLNIFTMKSYMIYIIVRELQLKEQKGRTTSFLNVRFGPSWQQKDYKWENFRSLWLE